MVRVSTIGDLRACLAEVRARGATVAFVPTMGALHPGHLALVDRARLEGGTVAMSIFVNPRQFGPSEDFERYPRPLAEDERLAELAGVDVLFTPTLPEMYPRPPVVTVSAIAAAARWEGAARPGHFDGVLTVVAKLLNIVQPDVAVFGQKDLQQAALVRAMARDLDLPVSVVVAPTVREADGLAMSSRNRFLSAEDRSRALVLSRALGAVTAAYRAGESDPGALEKLGQDMLARETHASVDYFAVVDADTFEPAAGEPTGNWAAITAARFGTTRLIDNALIAETNGNG